MTKLWVTLIQNNLSTDNDQYLPTGGQEAFAMSDTVITEAVGVSLSNGD